MSHRFIPAAALLAACLTLAACDNSSSSNNPKPSQPTPADNTGRNREDRGTTAKTPLDQSNSKADTDIAAAIRRALMEDKNLSTNGQNCKVIVDHGAVTLRGPVNTQAEKDAIAARAKAVAGVVSVDNQLEVKTEG